MVYGILMETIGISVVSIGLLLLLFLAGESPPPPKKMCKSIHLYSNLVIINWPFVVQSCCKPNCKSVIYFG